MSRSGRNASIAGWLVVPLASLLGACGQMGPLTLPEPDRPPAADGGAVIPGDESAVSPDDDDAGRDPEDAASRDGADER